MDSPNACKILKAIISLSILLHCANSPAVGQVAPSNQPGEIYAGIELTTEGVRAIALRVSRSEEEPGRKLTYIDFPT